MINGLVFNLRKMMKRPLKVGLITVNYFGKYKSDGVAVHAYRLSRELAGVGCEVHVFTRGEKNQVGHRYVGDGKVVVHEIKVVDHSATADPEAQKRAAYALFEIAVVAEIMKEHSIGKLDVIHTHNVGSGGAFISKHFSNIPWIHTFHSLETTRLDMLSEEKTKYSEVAKWMESSIKYADAHIAVSEDLRRQVVDHYDVPVDRVRVIPNAVNRDIFHEKDGVKREKCVGYVGRFSLEKGIDKIPEIIEKVFEKNDDVTFGIIAPIAKVPPELQKIEDRINDLVRKYPSRIIWHREAISRESLADFYSKCILLIQPSKYEGFGMTVLEAMSCGCVPIVSNCGGLPEVVGNSGKVVAPKSSNFSKEILKLLEDYRLRERYSKRAVERSNLFDWKDVGLKTLNLYKEFIKANKKEIEDSKDPKVSVIIPVYNVEKYIEDTINSFTKDKSFKDFELIAVDDNSTDKSYDVIKRLARTDSRIRILKNKANMGKNNSVNKAMDHVRGKYVCLFDSDDLNYPGRLKAQVSYLDRHPSIDLVYGDILKFYENKPEELRHAVDFGNSKRPLEIMKASAEKDVSLFDQACRILHPKDYIPASSTLFRKTVIDRGIRMDPALRNSEDYDFWFQIIGRGYRIRKIDGITYKYRIHEGQKSGNPERMRVAREYIFGKLKRGEYFGS